MSWISTDYPIERDSLLREALREKDLEIQRQRSLVSKLRRDRNLLTAELSEVEWKYEQTKVELNQCKTDLKKSRDVLKEYRLAESSSNLSDKNETNMYQKSINELLQRNEKQDIIVRKLIQENRSLRKEEGVKLPKLRVTQSRLTVHRVSIT